MDTSVVVQLSAQDAEMVAAWQRARKGPQGMAEELSKAGRAGKKAGEETADSFGGIGNAVQGAIGRLGGFAGGLGGVLSVTQLIKAEWDAIIERQREAAGTQVDLAASQRKAFEALGPNGDISREQLRQLVTSKSKIGLGQQYIVAEAALKEGGQDFSQKRSVETAIEAGRRAPHLDVGEISKLATGAVTLQQQVPTLTPAQAVAKVKAAARLSEAGVGAVAESMTPAVGRSLAFAPGTDPSELYGLFLALQKREDVGNPGAATDTGEKLLKNLSLAGAKGNLTEQLQQARTNKKIHDAVLKGAQKDPKAFGAIRDLLDAGSETSLTAGKYAAELGTSPDATLRKEEAIAADIRGERGQAAYNLEEANKRAKEKTYSGMFGSALQSKARETAALALELGGEQAVNRGVMYGARPFLDMGRNEEQSLRSTVNVIQQQIERIGGNQNNAEIVQQLQALQAAVIQELKNLKQGVPVTALPADTRSRPSAAAALSGN